jgi:hypothetical protein
MRVLTAAAMAAGLFVACSPSASAQAAASAQAPAIPRTIDGHPDFGGIWSSWFLTPLERGKGVSHLIVSEPEARKLAAARIEKARTADGGVGVDPDSRWSGVDNFLEIGGQYRTSRIVDPPDGRLPLTAEGKQIADATDKRFDLPPDGPEMRGTSERCMANAGIPPMGIMPNFNMRQVIQTPGAVVIYSEEGLDTRIIPFTSAHRPRGVAGPLGDSIARWDGEALVVETVGVEVEPDGHLIVRPEARVVERLQFLGADELLYRFTVEDPYVYVRPWAAEYTMKRSKLMMYEYACHEADESLYSMLMAARLDALKPKNHPPRKKLAPKPGAKGGPSRR